jgi:hypothetical protein
MVANGGFMKLSNNQRRLKLLLLVALAANMTWEPLKSAIQGLDMASEIATGKVSAPQIAQATENPDKPAEISKDAARAGNEGAKPAAAARPDAPNTRGVQFEIDQCNDKQKVALAKISEYQEDGAIKLQIKIYKKIAGTTKAYEEAPATGFKEDSRLSEVIVTQDDGTRHPSDRIRKDIRGIMAESLGKCETPVVAASDDPKKIAAEKADKEKSAKECRTDRDGKALDNPADRIKCQNDALEALDTDRTKDSRKSAASAIDKIVKQEILKDLRTLLSSKDEDKFKEGKELADDAIKALNSAVSSNGLTKSDYQRLENTIRDLVTASEIKRDSVTSAEEFKKLRSEIDTETKAYNKGSADIRSGAWLRELDPYTQQQLLQNPQAMNMMITQQLSALHQPLDLLQMRQSSIMQDFKSGLPMNPYTRNAIGDPGLYLSQLRAGQTLGLDDYNDVIGSYKSMRSDYDSMDRLILQARGVNPVGINSNPFLSTNSGSLVYNPTDVMGYRTRLAGSPGYNSNSGSFNNNNNGNFRQNFNNNGNIGLNNFNSGINQFSTNGQFNTGNQFNTNFGVGNRSIIGGRTTMTQPLPRPNFGNYGTSVINTNTSPFLSAPTRF